MRLYNKRNMTIVIPERLKNPQNPNALAARRMGCQMIAVRFLIKTNNGLNKIIFTSAGSAFVLKPPHLRFVQEYIPPPKKQDPRLFSRLEDVCACINFSI